MQVPTPKQLDKVPPGHVKLAQNKFMLDYLDLLLLPAGNLSQFSDLFCLQLLLGLLWAQVFVRTSCRRSSQCK